MIIETKQIESLIILIVMLNDFITAVFISHTKILTAIGSNNNSNIELVIPKTINFIHKSYINIAREIWKNPYLFDDYVSGSEYQKNMRTVELLIKDSIENTIRKLLPVKEILKQQLDIYDNQNENKNKINSDDIRKMLLEELKSLNNMENDEDNDDKNKPVKENVEDDDEDSNDSKENEELRERINNINKKFKLDLIEDENDSPKINITDELNEKSDLIDNTDVDDSNNKSNNYYESPDGYDTRKKK